MSRPKGPKSSNNFHFTINNEKNIKTFESIAKETIEKCRYICWGVEIAPTTGNIHLQGYFQIDKKTSPKCARHLVFGPDETSGEFSVETERGNAEDSRKYCMKEGRSFFEFGTLITKGKRVDLEEVAKKIKDNAGKPGIIKEIANEHPALFCQYFRGLERINYMNTPEKTWPTKIINYVGPSGVGKTTKAKKDFPNAYRLLDNEKWLGNYSGQEEVIIDNFEGKFPLQKILLMCDPTPLELEIKGGWVWWLAKTLIITSIKSCWSYYPEDPEGQLERRVTTLIIMDPPEVSPDSVCAPVISKEGAPQQMKNSKNENINLFEARSLINKQRDFSNFRKKQRKSIFPGELTEYISPPILLPPPPMKNDFLFEKMEEFSKKNIFQKKMEEKDEPDHLPYKKKPSSIINCIEKPIIPKITPLKPLEILNEALEEIKEIEKDENIFDSLLENIRKITINGKNKNKLTTSN